MCKNFINMLIEKKNLKNLVYRFLYNSNKITLSDIETFNLRFELIHLFQNINRYRESINLCDADYYKPLAKYLESLIHSRKNITTLGLYNF